MTPEQRALLEPFARAYARMSERIETATDDELRALCEAVDKPTSTNCWWAVKAAADVMKPLIANEFGRRTAVELKTLDQATKHLDH
jgi:CRISPR/Cas system CSM-associated protein Csm2 small subunit